MLSSLVLAVAVAAPLALGQQVIPSGFDHGECVTGRINFNPDRIFNLNSNDNSRFSVDRNRYDLTLDYGSVDYVSNGVQLNLVPPAQAGKLGSGARFSTTRYLRGGKITGRFKPVAVPGAVTTLITWSDKQALIPGSTELIQDEIDWEIVGSHPEDPEYNVFTVKSKALERGQHGGPSGANINTAVSHDFSIDWRKDRIDFGIDGRVIRTISKATSRARSSAAGMGDEPWFPTATSRVQFSVWDGSQTGGNWAGRLDWGNMTNTKIPALFEWIDIQCYDNNDNPVARWSAADVDEPAASSSSAAATATSGGSTQSTTSAAKPSQTAAATGAGSAPGTSIAALASAALAGIAAALL
ncbi:hypothetical protein HK105_209157 [Polyrhizophydium stewartii]|uniref:GH16 domain-containing protein n=1 Tax=Polyrhizophydium stewartii TaxID=2732419 RepID=A0ABR4MVV9_9FUNG